MSVSVGGIPFRFITGATPLSGDQYIEFTRPGVDGTGFHFIGYRGDEAKIRAHTAYTSAANRATALNTMKRLQGTFVFAVDHNGTQSDLCMCKDVQSVPELSGDMAMDSNNERFHLVVDFTLKSVASR